VQEERKTF